MSEIAPVKPPEEKSFGRTFCVVFAVIGGLFAWRGHPGAAAALFVLSAATLGVAYLAPAWLRLPNLLWFRFGMVLHRIVNPLVMGALFFLVFTPTGWIMRAAGKDFLRIGKPPKDGSLWIERNATNTPETSMTVQF